MARVDFYDQDLECGLAFWLRIGSDREIYRKMLTPERLGYGREDNNWWGKDFGGGIYVPEREYIFNAIQVQVHPVGGEE